MFINKALSEFLDITCVIYLDDILIFSWDKSKHEKHVQQVLAALQHYDLYLKISKCSFNAIEVNFLKFKINTKDIYMNLKRIWAVKEWLSSENVHELQIFLSFVNFFWRFIKNYSWIAALLLNLLKTERNKKKTEITLSSKQTSFYHKKRRKWRSSSDYSAHSSQVEEESQAAHSSQVSEELQ